MESQQLYKYNGNVSYTTSDLSVWASEDETEMQLNVLISNSMIGTEDNTKMFSYNYFIVSLYSCHCKGNQTSHNLLSQLPEPELTALYEQELLERCVLCCLL